MPTNEDIRGFRIMLRWRRAWQRELEVSNWHWWRDASATERRAYARRCWGTLDVRQCASYSGCTTVVHSYVPSGALNRSIVALPIEAACRTCGYCADCCECETCASGAHRHTGSNCEYCDSCSGCCDCRFCEDCNTRITRNVCRNGHCDECCECGLERWRGFFELPVTFHAAGKLQRKVNPSKRFVAVEIEVASARRDAGVSATVRKWFGSIVRDGSLPSGGFEINTAPASGDRFTTQIDEICAALRDSGATVTNACGLHVHVDVRDLRYMEIRRLISLYAEIEPLFFAMVPRPRRTSTYCVPCGPGYRDRTAGWKSYKDLRHKTATAIYGTSNTRGHRGNKYDGARYNALNLHSALYRGTVECRIFNGTVNAEKIKSWGMLWAAIVDGAANMSDAEARLALGTGGVGADETRAYRVLRTLVGGNAAVIDFVDERLKLYGGVKWRRAIEIFNTPPMAA